MASPQAAQATRRIAILGSTGSIGRQVLDVVRAYPDRFQVVSLAARTQVDLLAEQAREFSPTLVALLSEAPEVRARAVEVLPQARFGIAGLTEAATLPEVDILVAASSGLAGLEPTLAAIRAGKTLALANKETLVMAGHIVMAEARRRGVEVRPIDSEHNAIWQCLRGEEKSSVRRLLITASGGPFRTMAAERMRDVTPEQALKHPTWHMGTKITLDSATLMNKGLEVIEAHWLFDMPYDQIAVVVQPQSIIHSMVEFVDDSIKAQASLPSMHLPIQDALAYPERLPRAGTPLARPLSWPTVARLDFEEVDLERFPCLRLAYEAGRRGGTAPAVLVGADEAAVPLFLERSIPFPRIAGVIEEVLDRHMQAGFIAEPTLEEIEIASTWAQAEVRRLCGAVAQASAAL